MRGAEWLNEEPDKKYHIIGILTILLLNLITMRFQSPNGHIDTADLSKIEKYKNNSGTPQITSKLKQTYRKFIKCL